MPVSFAVNADIDRIDFKHIELAVVQLNRIAVSDGVIYMILPPIGPVARGLRANIPGSLIPLQDNKSYSIRLHQTSAILSPATIPTLPM